MEQLELDPTYREKVMRRRKKMTRMYGRSFTCAHTYVLKTKADRISEWKHQDVSALLCTAGTH